MQRHPFFWAKAGGRSIVSSSSAILFFCLGCGGRGKRIHLGRVKKCANTEPVVSALATKLEVASTSSDFFFNSLRVAFKHPPLAAKYKSCCIALKNRASQFFPLEIAEKLAHLNLKRNNILSIYYRLGSLSGRNAERKFPTASSFIYSGLLERRKRHLNELVLSSWSCT
jgi:hypothetical protein